MTTEEVDREHLMSVGDGGVPDRNRETRLHVTDRNGDQLHDSGGSPRPTHDDYLHVAAVIADWHGVSLVDIFSGWRRRDVVLARHWLIWWLIIKEDWTVRNVASLLDMDYSSVTYARDRIWRNLKYQPELERELKARLYSRDRMESVAPGRAGSFLHGGIPSRSSTGGGADG